MCITSASQSKTTSGVLIHVKKREAEYTPNYVTLFKNGGRYTHGFLRKSRVKTLYMTKVLDLKAKQKRGMPELDFQC